MLYICSVVTGRSGRHTPGQQVCGLLNFERDSWALKPECFGFSLMCWNRAGFVFVRFPSPLPDVPSISPHSKWKADRAAVTSLCVSPDGKLLLSAGQTIKMWDLDTKEVYRVSLHLRRCDEI